MGMLEDHLTEVSRMRERDQKIADLQAELDKAHRLVGQSIQWQRDAEIKLLKQGAEMSSDDCSTCDFVHMDTRKLNSRRWMCVKFPNLYKGRIGDFDEPYNRCTNIFMGYCELHTPRREGKVPE